MPEQRRCNTGGRAVRRSGKTGGRATVQDVRAVRQTCGPGQHDDGAGRDDHTGRGGVQVENVTVVGLFGDVRPGHAEQAGELPTTRRPGTAGQGHGGRRPAVRGGRGPTAGRAETVPATAAVRLGHFGGGHSRGHDGRRRLRLAAGRVARVFAHVRQEGPADEAGVLLPQGGRQEGAPQALRLGRPSAQEAQVQPAPVRRSLVLRRRPEQTGSARRCRRRARGQGVRHQRARAQRVRVLSRHAIRQSRRVSDVAQGYRKLFRDLRTEVKICRLTKRSLRL